MNNFLSKLLQHYSLTLEDFKKEEVLSIKDIKDFNAFKQAKTICDYLKEAIANNKKILIYGDYDADGIMSTSIIYLMLQSSSYTPGYYIPNREHDGYGITKDNIDHFHELGYEIIILVDNGISSNENIDYINSLEMECVILDHHSIMGDIPKAKYIMHPDIDEYGEYNISAGEVSFFLSWAYLNRVDDYLLVLATISAIGDVMPVLGYNKILIKEGLDRLNFSKIYDFKAIKNLVGTELPFNYIYTEEDISHNVVPKINSICRVLNDNSRFNIVKYFISGRNGLNPNLLNWINSVNIKRKALVEDKKEIEISDKDNAILTINDSVEGISGLIASSLLSKYNKPSFVICKSHEKEGLYKGSARAFQGFNVVECLAEAGELLEAYGGHEGAGGFSLREENIEKFREYINKKSAGITMIPPSKNAIEIDISDVTLDNYHTLRRFAPFGELHKAPRFKIKGLYRSQFTSDRLNKHLFFHPAYDTTIIYFNYDKSVDEKVTFDAIGSLKLNYFKDKISIQFIIEEVE